jgi:sterol desaturase/sphingolipid hydroxylase (fatty acid hydroxylase superfamily)
MCLLVSPFTAMADRLLTDKPKNGIAETEITATEITTTEIAETEIVKTATKSVTLEAAADEVHLRTEGLRITPQEYRKNYRTRLSGTLAKRLWYLLGGVVVVHVIAVIVFSWKLIEDPVTGTAEQRTERIQSAIDNVNETSKTLYTFLTPLVTAVTGYYFTTMSDEDSKDSEE